jgi:iron transport multicopper oxidase
VTGAAIASRQVQTPFLSSDIGCTDSPNFIGITGTPVIDPNTEIAYFFAATYMPNYRVAGDTGLLNGVMYFYAVNVVTLQDVPGFPILIDGTVMQNDPLRYFLGGIQNQRAVGAPYIWF